jgi:hypothetical protein
MEAARSRECQTSRSLDGCADSARIVLPGKALLTGTGGTWSTLVSENAGSGWRGFSSSVLIARLSRELACAHAYEPAGSPGEPPLQMNGNGREEVPVELPVITDIRLDNKHDALLTDMSVAC